MHADRTNRTAALLLALLLLAVGLIGALAGFGAFGTVTKHGGLLSNRVGAYFSDHGDWLWPVIAVAAALLALLALRWLLALLFSTDRAGNLTLTGDRSAGRTTLVPAALTDAVSEEISSYAGVQSARARLIGDASSPTLVVGATLHDTADLPRLRRRIETQAIGHARQALANPELPVRLDLSVTDRQASRVG